MHRLFLFLIGWTVLLTIACDSRGGPTAPSRPVPAPAPAPAPAPPPAKPITVIRIDVGQTVNASVDLDDPVCDPDHWDARATCKRFEVTAPADGMLQATLKAPAGSRDFIDVVLKCSEGIRDFVAGNIDQPVSARVMSGQSCFITINLYAYLMAVPAGFPFELRTAMQRSEES